ncbi:hypothetical protein C8C83_0681 [Flavobacterium sp. 90]|uniref:hypothetical protein n=1 Tax=unclassified Flavobacterium TaxID=196869 RepID=UPI000EAFA04F|nr:MULTISPECIES: hypothetical protein [unclassified Flavobacterium]RKR09081.1 hypothetical protein C8C82_0979 [Flavobacterium sp. 81]TCK52865.1 hypothetical protein C8C83_0681 [Flavobacterium sp. 90]
MAKKRINIILIIVVLALWGTAGYKALNRQFSGSNLLIEKRNQQVNINIKQIKKDTFKLEKIGRDPFLNKQFQTALIVPKRPTSNYVSVRKEVVTPTLKTDPNLSWPILSYYGYFESKEKKQELVLLKVDSKLCKLKINTPYNGLIVKKKYKDSIEVYFNSERKIVRLKK